MTQPDADKAKLGDPYTNVAALVVDVSNVAHRHAHAMSRFATADGRKSGHVYGSFTALRKLVFAIQPKEVVFVYDRAAPWRRELVPDYKSNRRSTNAGQVSVPLPEGQFEAHEGQPDDWTPSPDVERLYRAFPGTHLALDGFEADDLAAWYVYNSSIEDRTGAIVLFTNDRDYWQLVNDHEQVASVIPKKSSPKAKTQNMWLREEQVMEQIGVQPCFVAKMKALLGDDSDMVRGLEGASRPGKKDALKALAQADIADEFFDPRAICPKLPVPDWLAPELLRQRDRLIANLAVTDLKASASKIQGTSFVRKNTKANIADALGVLVEFECESLLSQAEPFLRELEGKGMPRPFG